MRTPVFPQFESAECGAACLGSVLAHFGRWESMDSLRDACGVSRDGSSAADIARAARSFGLEVSGWRKQLDELRDVALPAILFWDFRHFVVLERVGAGRYRLNDPANGRRTVDEETFSRSFTGIVLLFEPGPRFRAGGRPPGTVRQFRPWLRDATAPLAFVALCGLMMSVPGLALPALLSVFVDRVLTGSAPSLGPALVAGTALAGGVTYLLVWLRQRSLRRLAVRLSIIQSERFILRLLRLPAQYFARRFAGDLLSRAHLIDGVADSSSRQLVGIMVELVMSAVFLAWMLITDALLGAVIAVLGGVNLGVMRLLSRLRSDENRQLQREQALLLGVSASGLTRMDTLRATASEDDFFTHWSGYQARELKVRQTFAEKGYVIASLPRLFLLAGAAVALGLGGWRAMSGDMSVGTLMGFYVVAINFLLPIGRFVQFADAFQILEGALQRIGDVVEARAEPERGDPEEAEAAGRSDLEEAGTTRIATVRGRTRLAGRVELRNVSFGYRPNHPPLIDDLSLTVEAGQRVAVVGATGSGKSTLVRLITGEYLPWSGEVLFDGVGGREVPRSVLAASMGAVDQQILLFSGTVRENLTMWDRAVPEHRLVAAATDAMIHSEIIGRPLGYESPVEEGGTNFSSGQRQRLEIARALVNGPSILVLDEATSSLDALTEAHIDDSLRRRGCTCVIIAHRLDTIRDCDQIVVLDRGRAVQRGTHDDLAGDASSPYGRLVRTV